MKKAWRKFRRVGSYEFGQGREGWDAFLLDPFVSFSSKSKENVKEKKQRREWNGSYVFEIFFIYVVVTRSLHVSWRYEIGTEIKMSRSETSNETVLVQWKTMPRTKRMVHARSYSTKTFESNRPLRCVPRTFVIDPTLERSLLSHPEWRHVRIQKIQLGFFFLRDEWYETISIHLEIDRSIDRLPRGWFFEGEGELGGEKKKKRNPPIVPRSILSLCLSRSLSLSLVVGWKRQEQ